MDDKKPNAMQRVERAMENCYARTGRDPYVIVTTIAFRQAMTDSLGSMPFFISPEKHVTTASTDMRVSKLAAKHTGAMIDVKETYNAALLKGGDFQLLDDNLNVMEVPYGSIY